MYRKAVFNKDYNPYNLKGCCSHACLVFEHHGLGTNSMACYCSEKDKEKALRAMLSEWNREHDDGK